MKFIKIIVVVISFLVTAILAIYFWDKETFDNILNKHLTWNIIETYTGLDLTWNVSNQKKEIYKKILLENKDFWSVKEKTYTEFPLIKINNFPENIKLIATIDFSDNFKSLYKDYVTSPGYWFALKFFIWNFDNWWFYNVYRKTNWWLWNDPRKWLDWWQVWNNINWWYTWSIPLSENIKIAVPFEKVSLWYQYQFINPIKYLEIWKDLPIWVYLSSTKEVPWWKLMKIKELKIEYYWYEHDIIVK